MDEKEQAIQAIRQKLIGKHLSYQQIYAIMDEISHKKLGSVLTTYFAASGYSEGFSDEELYFLTQAMVETGEKLTFKGIVADKHSIGGVPGTRTTLIVVPIIASAGFIIPKSSSRAITTPDGTADDMEVLAPVSFSTNKIYEIVKNTNGCIVWGGSVNIAPADDQLIQVEKPLEFESFDKIVVSIMSKKIAFGSNHIVFDIPYGKSVKVHKREDAQTIADKFKFLASKFNVKITCYVHELEEPVGRGIGPLLETREALLVLEQDQNRPLDLEQHALHLASLLLDLCLQDEVNSQKTKIQTKYANTKTWAKELLTSGKAHAKMQEIIKAQGGKVPILAKELIPSSIQASFKAEKKGKVMHINSQNITTIAKILGAPVFKNAGIFLEKKVGDEVLPSDTLLRLYAANEYNLAEALETLKNLQLYSF